MFLIRIPFTPGILFIILRKFTKFDREPVHLTLTSIMADSASFFCHEDLISKASCSPASNPAAADGFPPDTPSADYSADSHYRTHCLTAIPTPSQLTRKASQAQLPQRC